jgi:hypothetical protein
MNEVLNIFEEQLRQIGNSRIGEFLDDSSQFETLGLLIIVPLILITFIAFYLRFRRENPPHPGRKGKYRRTGFRRIWLGNIHAEFVGALITGILFLIIGSVQAGFEAKEHRDDLIDCLANFEIAAGHFSKRLNVSLRHVSHYRIHSSNVMALFTLIHAHQRGASLLSESDRLAVLRRINRLAFVIHD